MHVVLDVTSARDGVLQGTAEWAMGPGAVPFHGVLELVAMLEAALAARGQAAERG